MADVRLSFIHSSISKGLLNKKNCYPEKTTITDFILWPCFSKKKLNWIFICADAIKFIISTKKEKITTSNLI
jgi:hypothetical protein